MNIVLVKENKNNQVKKANALIEAKGALSNTAQKMLTMFISMIRTDDSEFQEYALNINDYFSQVDSSSKNVEFAKDRALELMRNPFELKKGVWYNWCSKVDITKFDGYIVFSIHNDLKPYLLSLQSNFTTFNIVNILALKGDYTPRLYEYFLMRFNEYKAHYKKQHKKTPKSFTFEIEIDWLRDYFKIPMSYNYADIKRQIIEKAKKQLKAKTNIKFTYEEQKLGRKVVRLTIKIENNDKGSNNILLSSQSFIKHIQSVCKPDVSNKVYPTIITTNEGNIKLDSKGNLYLIRKDNSIKNYDAKQSKKLWNWLYELAKNEELQILK